MAEVSIDVCVISMKDLPQSFEVHLRDKLPVARVLTSKAFPISRARQELCEKASTPWFAFVDDDIKIVRDPMLSTAHLMEEPKNGAVEVRGKQGHPSAPTQTRAYTRFSFIRKEAVEGLSMPNMRHNEDLWIDAHMRSRGWRWPLAAGPPVYLHMRRYKPKDAYEVGYWNYGVGRAPFVRSWLGLFTTYPRNILAERRGRWTFTLWLRQLNYVAGITRARLDGYHYEQPGGLR